MAKHNVLGNPMPEPEPPPRGEHVWVRYLSRGELATIGPAPWIISLPEGHKDENGEPIPAGRYEVRDQNAEVLVFPPNECRLLIRLTAVEGPLALSAR